MIVTQYQTSKMTTEIFRTGTTPTDDDLIHAIGKAKSLGIKVMLKPHVDTRAPGQWRGQIGEGFTEAHWNRWFESYGRMIAHYARMAEEQGVDLFSIGTELEGTSGRERRWRELIDSVRGVYSGPITYAATTAEAPRIRWWDGVDYVGIDAYYPLTSVSDPTMEQLIAGWRRHSDAITSLAAGKPVIFTEAGFRSVDGANQRPWAWGEPGLVDLNEQADCYQATLRALGRRPWLAGMFWWVWGATITEGGSTDDDYTPQNKPAEYVLRYWYGGCRGSAKAKEP